MKISVIIPVYNVKPHLDNCIQSILKQDFADFECILVDDGSTDGSSEICDYWSRADSRIKVLHQNNQGVSSARNAGLKVATGEYISFIDSDDWVGNHYLSDLISAIEQNDSDLSVTGMRLFGKEGSDAIQIAPATDATIKLTQNDLDLFVELMSSNLLFGSVVKLYKSSIITQHNIRFDTNCDFGEDLKFNLNYLSHIATISTSSSSSYHYRQSNAHDTLSTKIRPNQFDIEYDQWHLLLNFFQSRNLLRHKAQEYLYSRLWGIVYNAIFCNKDHCDKSISYFRRILSIPEIKDLKHWESTFNCSQWIKLLITHRSAFAFYCFFKIQRSV